MPPHFSDEDDEATAEDDQEQRERLPQQKKEKGPLEQPGGSSPNVVEGKHGAQERKRRIESQAGPG